jgi:hypothetical protein
MRFIAISIAAAMLSISSHAMVFGKLFDKETCAKTKIECQAPAQLLHDSSDGRCGCLKNSDYIPADACMLIGFQCTHGSWPSNLVDVNNKFIGCGCYLTESA